MEENISTLTYATKASVIINEPMKGLDFHQQMVAELKRKNYLLQLELDKANKHIEFLTSLTAQKLETFGNKSATVEVMASELRDFELAPPIKENQNQKNIIHTNLNPINSNTVNCKDKESIVKIEGKVSS